MLATHTARTRNSLTLLTTAILTPTAAVLYERLHAAVLLLPCCLCHSYPVPMHVYVTYSSHYVRVKEARLYTLSSVLPLPHWDNP